MRAFIKHLTLLLTIAMAGPGLAQEAAAPATTEEAAPAATETTSNPDGIGEPYVSESHGDWQLRCVRTADGSDPCQLYQLLKDKETGNPISEISLVALPDGGDAAAGATIITPLETLLTQQMNISVDGGPTKRFPFTFCAEIGCVARVGFTKEDLAGFRKGKIAVISVVPVADPTRTVDVDISLVGFTAGFEAVAKANAPKE
ncbi:MAG: invasion associated locus B family protein [Albidovulum sp.]